MCYYPCEIIGQWLVCAAAAFHSISLTVALLRKRQIQPFAHERGLINPGQTTLKHMKEVFDA